MAERLINGQQLKGHLETLVLSLLAAQPLHGYGIMKSLSVQSGQIFEPGQGTVYPVLYAMVEKGLIRSKEQSVDGRKRRLYSLTARGKKMLQTRTSEWRTFETAMNRVLGYA